MDWCKKTAICRGLKWGDHEFLIIHLWTGCLGYYIIMIYTKPSPFIHISTIKTSEFLNRAHCAASGNFVNISAADLARIPFICNHTFLTDCDWRCDRLWLALWQQSRQTKIIRALKWSNIDGLCKNYLRQLCWYCNSEIQVARGVLFMEQELG